MGSKLLNVRLDPERVRKARALRSKGVPLSDVVREAIDQRYAEVYRRGSATDAPAIVRRIFDDHPDPPDLPERGYDVHDRRAARAAIARKLRQPR